MGIQQYNKALAAGSAAGASPQIYEVLTWVFTTYLGMPEPVAISAATAIIAIVGGLITAKIANKVS